jgi:ABC-2 type transport system ATP-binding protein
MSKAIVEFRGLTKIYTYGFWSKKQKALDQLTLSVPENSIYGFLGANGAGKTTGIKVLMGLQFATAGEVRIFGLSPEDPEAKARIGYLPERPYFHESMTAHQFLDFHRALFGGHLKGRKVPGNEELLDLVGLSQVSGKALKDFSKGMLQRAGIAQALVNDPDLVVLDEPMSGLDPVGRREIRDLIVKLGQSGKTIFFSSHILSDIESICHRIAFLEKGVLKFEGALSETKGTASGRKEIVFSGPPSMADSPALAGAVRTGEGWILKAEDAAAARQAIEELWRKGGTLISLSSGQNTLEDFLVGKGAERD